MPELFRHGSRIIAASPLVRDDDVDEGTRYFE
jgi:hypothetical protein